MRVKPSWPQLVLLGAVLSQAGSSISGSVAFAAGPNPRDVYVESITYGGSGCPQGTVGMSLSDDRTVFTLIFDSYVASMGPGLPSTESRKDCQLIVKLHAPQGWSYTIGDVTYRGFANLSAGTTGFQTSTYYFMGSATQRRVSTPITGPVAKDYTVGDRLRWSGLVWSSCTAEVPLEIHSAVSLVGRSDTASMLTTDSVDGKFKTVFTLQWKRC